MARGLGLGLSIVERIARVLDHKIDVRSTVGRGSRFSVEVPLRRPPRRRAAARERATLDRVQLSGITVLCIDNDLAILDGMETLLGGWGCRVFKAPDLEARIAASTEAQTAPNGLLVDYHLDDGNGIEAIVALRRRFGADLPAILITADRSPHVRAEARAQGIQLLQQAAQAGGVARAAGAMARAAASRRRSSARHNRARDNVMPARGLRPLAELDLRGRDHRLGAALDPELLQDRRDVRLHRRLRDAELVGDLLVEQALRQHHQHPHLLRRQRRQPRHQVGGLGIGAGAEIDVRRRPTPPSNTRGDRVAHGLDAERLRG